MLRASVNYVAPAGGIPFEDRDVHRLAELRRFMTLIELPLQCREPRCRRTRKCVGPTLRCEHDIPEIDSRRRRRPP